MNINACTPYQEGMQSEFVSKENRCSHVGKNPERKYIRQFKVDGEVFKKGKNPKRCDYLLLNDTDKTSYYIELKGSDICTAIEQIESTVTLIDPSIHYTVYRRIILHKVRPHEIRDNTVLKWKLKHKEAIIQSGRWEDVL